jgi:hypothetical protein
MADSSCYRLVVKRFLNTIYQCKPIREIGAQQMLLDTQSIKSLFLSLFDVKSVNMPAS